MVGENDKNMKKKIDGWLVGWMEKMDEKNR